MKYDEESGRNIVDPEDYECKNAKKFVRDALRQDLKPFHYEGRYYFKGPAVVCGIGDFRTKVKTQHDNMGLSYVIYPTKSANINNE